MEQSMRENKADNLQKPCLPGVIDSGAMEIMRTMEKAGYPTYIVGGCVRDLLLSRIPHDWDITTKARPDDIRAVAGKAGWKVIGNVGESFGVMLIKVQGTVYEVATFRTETYGKDSHRPACVEHADSLKEDLQRRDFTVNAMAMDCRGTLYYFFDGERDLKNKILKTVGKAADRLSEDALRLFRACRFLGQLDFMADSSLVDGMGQAFPRVRGLSLERVRNEVNRLLITPHAARGLDLLVRTGLAAQSCQVKRNGEYFPVPILPELTHLVGLPQMKEYHRFDGWYHTLAVVDAAPRQLMIRWAALLHDVGKGMPGVRRVEGNRITDHGHDHVGAQMAEQILRRWEMPEKFIHHVVWLVKEHMRFHYFANNPEANPEKWIRKMARDKEFSSSHEMAEAFREMTDLSEADIIGCGYDTADVSGHEAYGQYVIQLAEHMPVTTKELNYTQKTVETLKPYVADGMKNLLLRVQNGNLKNQEGTLYDAAIRYRRRRDAQNH